MPASPPVHGPVEPPSWGFAWWRAALRNNKLLMLISGLILLSGFVAVMVLLFERERTLAAGEHTTQAFAAVVEEQVSRTIQTVDQQLQLIALTLTSMQADGEPDPQAVRSMLRRQIAPLPFVRSIWTLDAQGRVRYSLTEGQSGLDLSDRDYFTVYKTRPGSGFFLGDPVRGRTSDAWLVSAARPLASRDGNFAGVIVVAIEPQYFDRLWQSMAVDTSGTVSLLRANGQMLLRSPWSAGASMGDNTNRSLITQYLPAQATGGFRSDHLAEGPQQFFAYRTLAERPDLVIIVGRALQAILAPWRSLAWLVLVLWLVVSLLATALAIYFQRLSGQRSLAEQRSVQTAHRLTLAAEAANIVVWDWDPRTDRFWATPTHYTSLGYPASEDKVDMARWRALIHEDDRARVNTLVDSTHSDPHVPYNYEMRMRHADGSYRWCHVIGRTIEYGSDGNPTRLIGVRMDVTERRRADLERQQIFNRITDGFVALDLQWRFIYANKQAGELLGCTPESLIGREIWSAFPARPGETFHLVCRQAMLDQKPSRLEAFYPEFGRWIEDHLYPSPQGLSIYFRDITQRKLDEEALRNAKEYAENLIAGANAMIVGLDTDGNVTLFNAAAQRLTGYTLEDFRERNWFELLAPRQRFPQVWEAFEKLQDGKLPGFLENPILTRAGEERLIAWQNSVLYQRGAISGTLSFGVDVTEQRRAEKALRNSQELFHALANHSMQGVVLMQQGTVVYANPAQENITGYSLDDARQMTTDQVIDAVHPDDRAAAIERQLRTLQGEVSSEVVELRVRHKLGGYRWLQVSAKSFTLGDSPARLGMLIDITDHKLAEQALRESEARFRGAFDSSGIGMSITALDGHWLQVNPALCNIVGYSADEMRQITFMDLTYAADLAADLAHMDDLLAGRITSFRMEKRYIHKRGHTVWVHLTVALVHDSGGRPLHTVAQMEDISQRKKLETDLRASQADLAATLDALPDLLFEVDIEGRHLAYHSPRTDLLVKPPEQLLGRLVSDVMHPAAATSVMDGLRETLATGRSRGRQIELDLPDGPHWFELTMARKPELPGHGPSFVVLSRDISERVLAAEALRTSEERFREMAENVREAFWLADVDKKQMLYVSPAFEAITGISVSSMLAEPQCWRTMLHPLDRDSVVALLDGVDRTKGYDLEYRIERPDGQMRWIHSRTAPIRDTHGHVYRVAGVIDDITDRKSLQLQDDVERMVLQFMTSDRSLPDVLERFVSGFESLLPGARGSVLLLDTDGIHIRHGVAPQLPQAFCDALNGLAIGPQAGSCGTAAYLGRPIVVADIDIDPLWQDYRDMARVYGLRACWAVPIKSMQGTVLGTFAFYFDSPRNATAAEVALIERGAHMASTAIESRRAAEQLQQGEERYRSLVQWTPLGIGVHQDGRIVYANPGCVAIFGAMSENELLGRPILDFIPEQDRAEVGARIARVLAGENMALVLRQYHRVDGSVIDVEGKAAPITFNGRPAVQFSMRDVTAERAAQAALLSSRQQLRVLSARVLAAQETERRRVAHELHDELGQALTALKINLQTQSHLRTSPSSDVLAENIRIVEHMLHHVRGLALALRPSMLDDLGLLPALRWLAEQQATRNGLEVVLRAPAQLKRLLPDQETAVFRIVQEALTNVLRHARTSEVEISLLLEGDSLRVKVCDNGVGFDVGAMQRRAAEGASIGVLGMIERASLVGATLTIDAQPGHGTTVELVCPIGAISP